ncbi:MAG: hypothetical protein ACFFD2_06850 [Promethearchaeota archaeon]
MKITWDDPNARINKLSYILKQLGIKIEDKVGILFHQSVQKFFASRLRVYQRPWKN